MTGRPFRLLVMGTGSIGMRHLRLLRAMPDVDVVAVPARAERVALLRADGFNALATLDEALASEPDGALVATDTGRHELDVLACLARCPVLVEKPMSVDRSSADRMAALAARVRRPLFVACCLRFHPGLLWLRDRMADIGRPYLIDVECLSWLPAWRPGASVADGYAARPGEGGVLLDLTHEIDYCDWLFGPAAAVSARLESRQVLGLAPGVEESAFLTVEYHSAVVVTMRLSYLARPASRRLRIWGERGMLDWHATAGRAEHVAVDGNVADAFTWSRADSMYEDQARAFMNALRGGDPGGLASAEAGVRVLAVCDAARRSAAEGRRIAI